jgi:hypothetical protein
MSGAGVFVYDKTLPSRLRSGGSIMTLQFPRSSHLYTARTLPRLKAVLTTGPCRSCVLISVFQTSCVAIPTQTKASDGANSACHPAKGNV